MLSQFGGDWLSNLIWLLFFILMVIFYPRLMISQILWRLDQVVANLSNLTNSAKKLVLKKVSKGTKNLKKAKMALDNFLEFFVIEPVSLDPFGIIKKFEHLINLSLHRFKYFAKRIAPGLDEEERANLMMGISGTITLYQLMKTVRHYVIFIRKTRNIQLALLLQMQIPLIEKISKAFYRGTEAFINGWPVGDGIGALVAASLIENPYKVEEIEEDTLAFYTKIEGKDVIIVKAKGPGGRLGKLGRAVEKIVKKNRISKIITIDAALRLEGEKPGSVAEGVGVAIGGIGIDKAFVEEIATKLNIPIDSIVIKVSQEEAIMPMKVEILNSLDRVRELVLENIRESDKRGKILIVGVGNTCGIGNSKKEAEEAAKKIRRTYLMLKEKGYFEEIKPKGFLWF